jgi:hypothetical protein
MPRTLTPIPEDPSPMAASSPAETQLDSDTQAVLDFLHGEYASVARGSAPTIQPGTTPSQPAQVEPPSDDHDLTRLDRLVYLPAASHCYAIV